MRLKKITIYNSVLGLVLPIIIIVLVLFPLTTISINRILNDKFRQTNTILTYSIDARLKNFYDQILNLIRHDFKTKSDSKHMIQHLVDVNDEILSAYLSNRDGFVREIFPHDDEMINFDISGYEYFKKVVESGQIYWGPSFLSPTINKQVATLSVPLDDYILTMDIDLTKFVEEIESVKLTKDIEIAILDQNGTYIGHTDKRFVETGDSDHNFRRFKGKFKNAILQEQARYYGKEYICYINFSSQSNWAIIIYQDANSVYFTILRILFPMVVIIVIILFSLVFSNRTIRYAIEAIKRLEYITEELTEDRYDRVNYKFEIDEANDLLERFHNMADVIKKRENELNKKLVYEQLLSKISSLGLSVLSIDLFVSETIEVIGRELQASRVFMVVCAEDEAVLHIKNEWCNDGVSPYQDSYREIPSIFFKEWLEILNSGHHILVSDITGIEYERIRTLFQEMGIASFVLYPIFIDNKLYGFLGLEHLNNAGYWDETDISLLKPISRLISSVIEKNNAEYLINEKERQLKNIASNLPHGMIYRVEIDESGNNRKFLYISEGVEQLHEIRPDEVLSDPFKLYNQIFDEDIVRFTDIEINSLKSLTQFSFEARFRLPSGKERWGLITSAPRKMPDGTIVYDGLELDITKSKASERELIEYRDNLEEIVEERTALLNEEIRNRKIIEEELKQKKDEAEKANNSKSMFLANMSHEMRTPFNSILGFSKLLRKDETESADHRNKLDIIIKSSEHLLSLIDNILEVSKIESGHTQVESKAFDLDMMINEVVDMMKIKAAEKGISLYFDRSSKFVRYVSSDELKIRQIFINLINNSIKYTEQGYVKIELNYKPMDEADKILLVCRIEDTGVGIEEEDIDKIFTPFERLTQKSLSTSGAGLGLSITKQYLELLKGTIEVESKIDVGSVFTFCIPIGVVDKLNVLKNNETLKKCKIKSENNSLNRILIVEDQYENSLLLKEILENAGFQTEIAINGVEAIETARRWHPDLIFMDWRMPIMDGVEATKQIKMDSELMNIKIVALTAHAFSEYRDEMLDAGADDFIRKPFKEEEILDSISKHLNIKYNSDQDNNSPAVQFDKSKFLDNRSVAKREWTSQQKNDVLVLAEQGLSFDMVEYINKNNLDDNDLAKEIINNAESYNYDKIIDLLTL